MRWLSPLVWCCYQAAGGLQWPELESVQGCQEIRSQAEKKDHLFECFYPPCPFLCYVSIFTDLLACQLINWPMFSVSKARVVMFRSQQQRLQTIPGSPEAYWTGLYVVFASDVFACGLVSRDDLVKWALLDQQPDLLWPQLRHPHRRHHFPLQWKMWLTKSTISLKLFMKLGGKSNFLLFSCSVNKKKKVWKFIDRTYSFFIPLSWYYFHLQHFYCSHDDQFLRCTTIIPASPWDPTPSGWSLTLEEAFAGASYPIIKFIVAWRKKKDLVLNSSVYIWHQIMQMCPPSWLMSNLIKKSVLCKVALTPIACCFSFIRGTFLDGSDFAWPLARSLRGIFAEPMSLKADTVNSQATRQ